MYIYWLQIFKLKITCLRVLIFFQKQLPQLLQPLSLRKTICPSFGTEIAPVIKNRDTVKDSVAEYGDVLARTFIASGQSTPKTGIVLPIMAKGLRRKTRPAGSLPSR